MTWLTRFRLVQRVRPESGAAVVEAVLVTPLFLLLVLGIIELGPAFMNWNAIHGASREGARVGSIAGTNPNSDFQILHDIKQRLRPSIAGVNYIIVFKATSTTDDPPADCLSSAQAHKIGLYGPLTGKCNIYYANDFARPEVDFGNGTLAQADANWPAILRNDAVDNADKIGVHISTDHRTLTGVIPATTMDYTTVFAIESTTGEGT
jgi:TadE-like protein